MANNTSPIKTSITASDEPSEPTPRIAWYDYTVLFQIVTFAWMNSARGSSSPTATDIATALFIVFTLATVFVYARQYLALGSFENYRPYLQKQFAFLLGISFIPTAAGIAGDLLGALNFHNSPSSSAAALLFIPIGGLIGISVLSVINLLTFTKSSIAPFLNFAGRAIYWIGWFFVVVASFFIYSGTYNSHDPNLE